MSQDRTRVTAALATVAALAVSAGGEAHCVESDVSPNPNQEIWRFIGALYRLYSPSETGTRRAPAGTTKSFPTALITTPVLSPVCGVRRPVGLPGGGGALGGGLRAAGAGARELPARGALQLREQPRDGPQGRQEPRGPQGRSQGRHGAGQCGK
jgi:hypothetical protein